MSKGSKKRRTTKRERISAPDEQRTEASGPVVATPETVDAPTAAEVPPAIEPGLAMESDDSRVLDEFFVGDEERDLNAARGVTEMFKPEVGRHQDAIELLAFWVADEEYAIDIVELQEIIKVPIVTEVPRAPTCVLGIVSLRGTIVPVIDLRSLLHLPKSEVSRANRVLVLRGEGEPVGLLVDRVTSVVRFGRDTIEDVPRTMRQPAVELLAGVGRDGDRMLIVLALKAILDAIEVAA